MASEPSASSFSPSSPSAFLRQRRPELYSDSLDRVSYQLDASMLEFQLNSITERNETHEFEIFCRKLCGRVVCPNLLPMTGPEGGGDSKADSETFPVAEDIAKLWYVGSPEAARESWAFAFSAKKNWSSKIRDDVAGIVATGRGYTRIYFVTSRPARSKDRARVQDELRNQYGVDVRILDRSWIVEEIIGADRRDLAFHYLGVGQEVTRRHQLGPNDYSRDQQLADIEKQFDDPAAFENMPLQRVTEALVAAKLSRHLERPRVETDGRFARAIRLADEDGTFRQRITAHYEYIWTNYWWFDDTDSVLRDYDAFEELVLPTDYALNIVPLLDVLQLLYGGVVQAYFTAEAARLDERVGKLRGRLEPLAADPTRPNNALEACASLLLLDLNEALRTHDSDAQSKVWPRFSEVLQRARGMGEFDADRWRRLIEAVGEVVPTDPGYGQLVDDLAEFVATRTSEGQGALVLLRRVRKLGMVQPLEVIRLCGRAVPQLTKREYADEYVEAQQLLGLAYREVGLWWAARASLLSALATLIIQADDEGEMPIAFVGTTVILTSIALELRHLPDTLEGLRLLRGSLKGLPLDEQSQTRLQQQIGDFDLQLASLLVNFSSAELSQAAGLPDVLDGLDLPASQAALLYTLGYEDQLRSEGRLASEHHPQLLADLYSRLAGQPFADPEHGPVLFHNLAPGYLFTRVLGIAVEVHHSGTEVGIVVAEAAMAAIEAVFATALTHRMHPHTEVLRVNIHDSQQVEQPSYDVERSTSNATLYWPTSWALGRPDQQPAVLNTLNALATTLLAGSCVIDDPRKTLASLADEDVIFARLMMVTVAANSRHRAFGSAVGRVSEWLTDPIRSWPPTELRPRIVRMRPPSDQSSEPATRAPDLRSHRELAVRSVIDVPNWNQAGWTGTGFLVYAPPAPPALALLFTDPAAARRIFLRWRERFGMEDIDETIRLSMIRGISTDHPLHYRFMVTSSVESVGDNDPLTATIARMLTIPAESDTHWKSFEESFHQSEMYWLIPGFTRPGCAPEFLPEIGILKRELHVRQASEVKEGEIDWMAVVAPVSAKQA